MDRWRSACEEVDCARMYVDASAIVYVGTCNDDQRGRDA
jgi:hypothetical protein